MKINNVIPFFAVFLLILMGCTQDEVIKEDTSVGGKENIRYRYPRRSYHPYKPRR